MSIRACQICNNDNVALLKKDFIGYIKNTKFDIFYCPDCNTEFIDVTKINKKVYDLIYGDVETPGYERYLDYTKIVKIQKDPLKFLAFEEPSYFPIYTFLKNTTTKLKILEVGCSYGYLSYALSKHSHDVTGLDISAYAIDFARKCFPDVKFVNEDIFTFNTKDRFDIIVSNEVVEHLENIPKFLMKCKNLLKRDGAIILATQNKSIYKDGIWVTELPPVHTFWFSKESFIALSRLGFSVKFIDFDKYYGKKELKFMYLFKNHSKKRSPILNEDGSLISPKRFIKTNGARTLRTIFYFFPIRYLLKKFSNLFERENTTLGIILKKRKDGGTR